MYLFPCSDGKVYTREIASLALTALDLPNGVELLDPAVRPDWALIPNVNRLPMVGAWDSNLVWVPEGRQLWKLGIEAPEDAPTLGAGMGTGITGEAIGVYTFAHYISGALIHEGNPSPSSGTFSMANQNRLWGALPTAADLDNARITHLHLYVSMDGSEYQFVAAIDLSDVTFDGTFEESLATAALGDFVSRRRGVPPYSRYVTVYHRRAWYADGSGKVYYSEIDEPESVAATDFMVTQDGRKVTCIRGLADQLVVGTRRSLQDVQGYTEDDFEMRTISQHIGIISHHASRIINDKLWLMSQDGYYRFGGGGIQYMMANLRSYFRDSYLANQAAYEDSVAAVDLYEHVLKVLIPGDTSFYYVAHFLPCEAEFGGGSGLPFWTFDVRTRKDETLGVLSGDGLRDELYTGSCDGFVRKENVASDADDDGDAYRKAITIATKHFFMGDQSGDDTHGLTFNRLDMFVRSERTDWLPSVYTGDDDALSALSPRWTPGRNVPASAQSKGTRTSVAKTAHSFTLASCSGKGATVKVTVVAPIGFEYRGLGLEFQSGGENGRDRAT